MQTGDSAPEGVVVSPSSRTQVNHAKARIGNAHCDDIAQLSVWIVRNARYISIACGNTLCGGDGVLQQIEKLTPLLETAEDSRLWQGEVCDNARQCNRKRWVPCHLLGCQPCRKLA